MKFTLLKIKAYHYYSLVSLVNDQIHDSSLRVLVILSQVLASGE